MRRFALLLAAAGLLASAASSRPASAQTPYQVAVSQGAWIPLSGGSVHAPVAYGAIDAWDEGAAEIPLPFAFRWFGEERRTIWAFTNGFFSFAPPPAGASVLGPPSAVPSRTTRVRGFIAPAWQDYDGTQGRPEIRAQTFGAAPSRTFVVQVTGLTSASSFASAVNYQLRLSEATQEVRVVYGLNSGVVNGTSAVQSEDGLEGLNLLAPSSGCGPGCACAPGACFSSSWSQGRTVTLSRPAAAELTGRVSAPPGAHPGEAFAAAVTVTNAGLAAAAASALRVELSSSPSSLVDPVLLGALVAPALPPATSVTLPVTLAVPAGAGVGRYVLALSLDVDGAVVEADEAGNLVLGAPFATGPDLEVEVEAPARTGPGELLPVNLSLASRGAPVLAPVEVSFHFSVDATLGPGDVPAGQQALLLPDGFAFEGVFEVPVPAGLPLSATGYHLLAVADAGGAVAELDEADNVGASLTRVEVRAPDLGVAAVTSEAFAFRGLPLPVLAEVRNSGGGRAGAFTVCVALEAAPGGPSRAPVTLLETAPLQLAAGESQPLRLEAPVPAGLAPGPARLVVRVDCGGAVAEVSEADNALARAEPLSIRDPGPDLAVLEVAAPSAAAAGEALDLSFRVANRGNAAGEVALRVVLSANPGVSVDDPALGPAPPALTLAPGEDRQVSARVTLPVDVASGAYHVGVIADPEGLLDEVREDDGASASGPVLVRGAALAIVGGAPPPAPAGVPYVRRFFAVGGEGDLAWSLRWARGAPPAGVAFDPAAAELSGTPLPADEGRHPFRLEVRAGRFVAALEAELVVVPATLPLTVVSSRLPPALAREPYQDQLLAVGGVPPYRWVLTRLTPTGLALDPGGLLGGEPQLPGAYNLPVEVVDAIGARATSLLSLDVVDPTVSVGITTASVPGGQVGAAYVTAFAAAGGTPPYRWVLEGRVPGLSFDPATARLTGTPTVAGDHPLVVEVHDAGGLFDRNAYVVSVLAEGALAILTGRDEASLLPVATLGRPYVAADGTPVQLRATGADGLRWTLVGGALPPGLALDPVSGVLSGTPTATGVHPFIVLAADVRNDVRRAVLAIEVAEPGEGPGPRPVEGCGCDASGGAARGLEASLLLLAVALFARGAVASGRGASRACAGAARGVARVVSWSSMLGAAHGAARAGKRRRQRGGVRGAR